MKKLSDEKITHLESWYKSKKDALNVTPEERVVLDRIKGYIESNWAGMRQNKDFKQRQLEAREQLEKLKRKEI